MQACFSSADVARRLPVSVSSADQYWGSFVKICGNDPSGVLIFFRLLYCDWAIAMDGVTVAESSASADANQSGLALLVGCVINEFIIDSKTHRVTLVCGDDLQISLATNLVEYEDDDQMVLVCVPGAYISYCPKLGLVAEPRSEQS